MAIDVNNGGKSNLITFASDPNKRATSYHGILSDVYNFLVSERLNEGSSSSIPQVNNANTEGISGHVAASDHEKKTNNKENNFKNNQPNKQSDK